MLSDAANQDRPYDGLVNVVELFARHDPQAIAFLSDGESQTYGELTSRVARARTSVAQLCKSGSNIVIIGNSSISFVEIVFAALSAGLPVVPLHPRYPRGEVERAVELARPMLVISTDGASASLAKSLGVAHIEASELFEDTEGPTLAPLDLEPDHPALLMFTSGTAGSPRIAVLSHGNIAASIGQVIDSAPQLSAMHHVILGVMPLTHVLGIVSVVAVAIAVGSTIVLTNDVDVDAVAASVSAHHVTFLVASPVFWYRLANSQVEPALLASVSAALSGAAPLREAVAVSIADRYSIKLCQGYGLTEASPGLASALGTDAPVTSVGRPMPRVTLRIVDEFGNDAPMGDVGEIWAQGDNIFAGYLDDSEATESVIDADGWLHTGDLATCDEDGFLFIVGRNNDQIIVSGSNVHPGEVEERLEAHHTVQAAAVVGEPDDEYGEVVVAYVVAARGMEPDDDVLEAHCRTRLAGYKVPSRFEVVDELPRGHTGKIRRRMLRG